MEAKEYNKVRRKGRKEFINRPTLIPCRKVLRMRAKHNMRKEGGNRFLHRAIKAGQFGMHWREYATR